MTDLFTICKNALDSMGESPKSLGKALSAISGLNDLDTAVTSDDFFDLLKGEDTNEPIAILFHERLASWDYASSPPWGEGSDRNTTLRRRAIYRTLSLTVDQQNLCDARFPYAPALDPPILIAGSENSGWRPWYTPQRASARKFYWKSYFGYLRDTKHWEAKNLAALDESTNDVIARLTDPEQQVPYQSKGLVVGFVQSGKTANFTGVIARAADAGYRLFIVLAGTINILRDQTQRRIDKELIGTDMCQDEQYELDEDYSEFVSHNGFPSERQAFDWERLTGSKEDFKRLKKGISALEFRRFDSSKPFFNPGNLHRDRAKLAVVKKNTTVLDKLIADLKSVGRKVDLSAVPALVIDDESDQASVNTVNAFQYRQRGKLEKERKARSETNNRIVTLLKTLPRAQYVGYTATPFANVFVDPEDAEDLFPSDFIVSLPRPEGYMGVREFYDDVEPQKGDYSSNQNAFVRFIEGPDEKAENLVQAIDAFVLSGAIKLYRSSRSGGKLSYKHHTMLIHNSPWVNAHAEQADRIEHLLTKANYLGGGVGLSRLSSLWSNDFLPVSQSRGEYLPFPASFHELLPHIGECCRKLDEGPKPVLIINGNNRDDSPNFEKTAVWKILVGGTKLSRGYTVEGLTVSYYRRRAGAADTLMQMGRWFGFRKGYKDLVRLYIAKREPLNNRATKFINLYEAFRATCLDEEQFRDQLKRYSSTDPSQRITPKQVPPLVSQHMLPPTSKNKMFNAKIAFKNLGGEVREKTVAPFAETSRKHNEALTKTLLDGLLLGSVRVQVDSLKHGDFPALVTAVSPDRMVAFLSGYQWLPGREKVMTEVLEFLSGENEHDPEIDRWLFVAPQQKKSDRTWLVNKTKFDVRLRTRVETDGRYKVYSEPDHISAAKYLAGLAPGTVKGNGGELLREKQGVFLFYPILSAEEKDSTPTMAFALVFPPNHISQQIAYTVEDHSKSDAVVVPKP